MKSSEPSKVTKTTEDVPDLPDRNHPAYLSEGKGSRKRKNSGKENKESRGKDRSHSFHGKVDKKERKHIALERQNTTGDVKKYKNLPINSNNNNSSNNSNNSSAEETVVSGARSILLTEDNLVPIQPATSPDLIQDLPRPEDMVQTMTSTPADTAHDDDDYVEADSVADDATIRSDETGDNINSRAWTLEPR